MGMFVDPAVVDYRLLNMSDKLSFVLADCHPVPVTDAIADYAKQTKVFQKALQYVLGGRFAVTLFRDELQQLQTELLQD